MDSASASDFVSPMLTFGALAHAAGGAATLWLKLHLEGRETFVFDTVFEKFGVSGTVKSVLVFVAFVCVGAYIAVLFTQPVTATSAWAAGMAWTGFLSIKTENKQTSGATESIAPKS